MKKYIDKLKEIETLIELSLIENKMTEDRATDIYALTNELMLMVKKFKYLILSGEGGYNTENQFLMECSTLEEANAEFDEFKKELYENTWLYIYEATKLREE